MVVWFLWWGLVVENKQEEDISWLFLWGATILYIAVLCMTFAAIVVTRPTVGAAFLEFTKDYGALLAGIPVLIAVLVAKQQLDANRRQHIAQIKRSFQRELDALQECKQFAQRIRSTINLDMLLRQMALQNQQNFIFMQISTERLEYLKQHVDQNVIFMVVTAHQWLRKIIEEPNLKLQEDYFYAYSTYADIIDAVIAKNTRRLSQYWS